jgi:stress response protein YsnF
MRTVNQPKADNGSQSGPDSTPDDVTLSAIDEQLSIGMDRAETGAVRVQTVNYEEMKEIPLTLRTQSVEVKRVPVNRPVLSEYEPQRNGDTLIVPVFEYVPVTEMRLMLKEEVHIRTTAQEVDVLHHALVQKQAVVVERRDNATGEWVAEEDSTAVARDNGAEDLR